MHFFVIAGHPEIRQLYGVSQYKNFAHITGGTGSDSKRLYDVWRLDLDHNSWKCFGNILPVDTIPASLGWHLSTVAEVSFSKVF